LSRACFPCRSSRNRGCPCGNRHRKGARPHQVTARSEPFMRRVARMGKSGRAMKGQKPDARAGDCSYDGSPDLAGAARRAAEPATAMNDEWESLSLLEKRALVTRLALARMRAILTLPLPPADDVSIAAQEERELQLQAAQSVLANGRRAKE